MPAAPLPPFPLGYAPLPHGGRNTDDPLPQHLVPQHLVPQHPVLPQDPAPGDHTAPAPGQPDRAFGRMMRGRSARRTGRLLRSAFGVLAVALLVAAGPVHGEGPSTAPAALIGPPVPAGQQTLLPAAAAPAAPGRHVDLRPVELGLRFDLIAPAEVSGLRYFRTGGDSVAHTARLWDPAGRALGSLTFPAATTVGWQYASFDQPLPLGAGKGYTASYHTSVGYAAEPGWFGRPHPGGSSLGTATAGVYTYSSSTALPSSSYKGANYWVDLLLRARSAVPAPVPAATPPAATPPAAASGATVALPPAPRTGGQSGATAAPGSAPHTQPAGPIAPAATAAPMTVGYLGDRSKLRVIDGPATAPAGTTWSNGTLLVAGSGVVLDGVLVKGSVDYSGSGTLTVRNSVIEASGKSWSVVLGRDPAGTLDISDSTIVWPTGVQPPGSSWGNGAVHGDSRMVLVRDDISGTPDGIQQGTGNSLFQQNYIHDLATLPGTHNDGIQLYEGPGVRIIGNYIDLKGYSGTQNSAVFVANAGNGYDRPVVSGNYLAGGGYQLRLESGALNATVTDNRFGPLNGGWGEVLVSPGASVAVWSGNVAANGSVLPRP